MALSTDGNARWCALDPRLGTALIVAEAALNVACAGALPVALVNCLNFGNPEHPEVMWQLSEAIDGMAEACRALGLPVVGGNVSLYNESRGRDIDPTPVVGVLGLIDRLDRRPPPGGARRRRSCCSARRGPSSAAPRGRGRCTATAEANASRRSTSSVTAPCSISCARSSSTGSSPACTTCPTAASAWRWPRWRCAPGVGFTVTGVADHLALFSESPSRVVTCVDGANVAAVISRATAAGMPATEIGRAHGDRLVIEGLVDVSLADATSAWRDALPNAVRSG